MPRRKPFRVGDEVVVLNGRHWVAPPARTSVIEEVHPRGVYIKGHTGFLSKDNLARRTENSEKLGRLLDLLAKLEDEFQEERHQLVAPLMEKYEAVKEPLRQEAKALWAAVHEERGT